MTKMFDGQITRSKEEREGLVEQHGGEVREHFNRNYFGQAGLGVAGVDMKSVQFNTFDAEFLVRNEDLIIHFFAKEGVHWHESFRGKIFNAMVAAFRLENRHERVVIEWVDEFYSWCVTIKSVAVISPPDDEKVLEALSLVESPDAVQE